MLETSGLKLQPNNFRSFVKRRIQKRNEFNEPNVTVEGNGFRTSISHFKLNRELIDTKNSYISFTLQVVGSPNLQKLLLKPPSNLLIDTHPISLIRNIRLNDKHNKEIFKIDNVNKIMVQHLSNFKDNSTISVSLGFNKNFFIFFNQDQTNRSQKLELCIPLFLLGGIFDIDNLLSYHIMSDAILEIDWETAENAFTVAKSSNNLSRTTSDQWSTTEDSVRNEISAEIFDKDLIHYEITDLTMHIDCYELEKEATDELEMQYNSSSGFQMQFQSYRNQFTDVFKNKTTPSSTTFESIPKNKYKVEIPIIQSFTQAMSYALYTWPRYSWTNSDLRDTYATPLPADIPGIKNWIKQPLWFSSKSAHLFSSIHQNYSNFIEERRTRLHNYNIPQTSNKSTIFSNYKEPPYTEEFSQNADVWKKQFLRAIEYNTIRYNIEPTASHSQSYVQQKSNPLYVRLCKSYIRERTMVSNADIIEYEGVKVDFNHPLALQLTYRDLNIEALLLYNGYLTFVPAVKGEVVHIPGGSPPTYPIPNGVDEDEFWYWLWSSFFKVEIMGMISVYHVVNISAKPSGNLVFT